MYPYILLQHLHDVEIIDLINYLFFTQKRLHFQVEFVPTVISFSISLVNIPVIISNIPFGFKIENLPQLMKILKTLHIITL